MRPGNAGDIGGVESSSQPSGPSNSLSEGAEMESHCDLEFDSDFMDDFMDDFSFSEEDGFDFDFQSSNFS